MSNKSSPSVVTYRQLQNDPETSATDAELLEPSIGQANAAAKRLSTLPQVSRTFTLSSFVPKDQDEKITQLKAASKELGTALNPSQKAPAPDDHAVVEVLQHAAKALSAAADHDEGAAADTARNVSAQLSRLASGDAGVRQKAEAAFVPPLVDDLKQLRESLAVQPITRQALPPDLVRDWVLPDGRARKTRGPRPRRPASYQGMAICIISIAQQATPKVGGDTAARMLLPFVPANFRVPKQGPRASFVDNGTPAT